MGRKRIFTDRWGDSLFRSAYAFIPQSTVGDLLNESIVKFYNNYGKEYLIAKQLHDAIYVYVKEKDIEDCVAKLRESMIRPIKVNHEMMTIDVDFKVGPNWKDMEDLEI